MKEAREVNGFAPKQYAVSCPHGTEADAIQILANIGISVDRLTPVTRIIGEDGCYKSVSEIRIDVSCLQRQSEKIKGAFFIGAGWIPEVSAIDTDAHFDW